MICVAAVAQQEGADRPGRQSGGGGKNGGDKRASGIHDFWGRQNCCPPRAPIIHVTPQFVLYGMDQHIVNVNAEKIAAQCRCRAPQKPRHIPYVKIL